MELSFRHESARLIAGLVRLFGDVALAEDVAQDVLCRAFELWKYEAPPDDPRAWLTRVAKNRALDLLRRDRTARRFAPMLESEWTRKPLVEASFEDESAELRLIFACCQPHLPEEVQIALVLQLACGFSASEIAQAFLAGTAAIEKRLARGKKALDAAFEPDFAAGLAQVQRAFYLLFNEGYHGTSAVRAELCSEAMRLSAMLLADARTAQPSTRALAALFCLHAARLPGRVDEQGALQAQDPSRWNRALIAQGMALLEQSAEGDAASEYHYEAAIAAAHCAPEPDFGAVVPLYDRLLALRPSPVIALNRAIAIGRRDGPARGLEALAALDAERLAHYPFLAAARADCLERLRRQGEAREAWLLAARLARSAEERRYFEQRAGAL